jgi:hypothetical protein
MCDTDQEIIVSVAVYHGCIWSLPKPARHSNVLESIHAVFIGRGIDFEAIAVPPINQGFITNRGRFVNRTEAMQITYRAKQLLRSSTSPYLYSEDLW